MTERKTGPKKDTRFKKGWKGGPGRPPLQRCYPDALRKWLSLSPKELFEEAKKPMKTRDDITVLQAWALLDAAQGMKAGEIRHREFGLNRTEGKAVETVRTVAAEFIDDTADPIQGTPSVEDSSA